MYVQIDESWLLTLFTVGFPEINDGHFLPRWPQQRQQTLLWVAEIELWLFLRPIQTIHLLLQSCREVIDFISNVQTYWEFDQEQTFHRHILYIRSLYNCYNICCSLLRKVLCLLTTPTRLERYYYCMKLQNRSP